MQTITTKFLGATNCKGERVKATSSSGLSITIPWSYSGSSVDCHFEAVQALCNKLKWKGDFIPGCVTKGYVWVFRSNEVYTVN